MTAPETLMSVLPSEGEAQNWCLGRNQGDTQRLLTVESEGCVSAPPRTATRPLLSVCAPNSSVERLTFDVPESELRGPLSCCPSAARVPLDISLGRCATEAQLGGDPEAAQEGLHPGGAAGRTDALGLSQDLIHAKTFGGDKTELHQRMEMH